MINKLFRVIKKVVFILLLLYEINVIVSPLNVVIPINIYAVLMTFILGIPGLTTFIVLYLVV